MRIVLLNQYYAPSEAPTAVLCADLARELVERGHEVHIVASTRAYNDPRRTYPRRETIDGVRVHRTRTSGFGRGGKLGRILDYATYVAGAAWAVLRLPRPDLAIVLTTPPLLARIVLPLARWRGARLIYWVMDVYPDLAFKLGVVNPRGLIGRILARAARTTLVRADRVVALGPCMVRKLSAQVERPIETVDNWCDGRQIYPRDRANHPLRAALGWGDRFVVLYSGNMGLAHEFETVLDAAERLRDRSEILFAFVGGGARLEEIRRGAAGRGLSRMEFHPYVSNDELPLSLTAGDLHLVTLRDGLEGLLVPSKIYGVMAAGRPAIYVGPLDSEIAKILAEAQCGVRVPVGQSERLVREILRFAEDPGYRQAHARRARESFERRYDRPHAVSRLSALVESLGAEDPAEGSR